MKTSGPIRVRSNAFTLLEMLVAMAILSLLMVLFSSILSQTIQAWSASQQRVEKFQNGRAILEIMARELAPGGISQDLQFVQNPATSGASNLSSLLASSPVTTQTANSDSLFWARPATANAYGNMYETGYFLTMVASTPKKYELVRFNVAPNNAVTSQTASSTHGANSSIYWMLDPPTAYNPVISEAYSWPEYSDAPWLTTLSPAQFQGAISVVSEGVIALWIRCLDKNGDAIPWLYQSSLYSSATPPVTTLKFNSAAAFTPAILGVHTNAVTSDPTSFAFTAPPVGLYLTYYGFGNGTFSDAPSGTVAANRLPSAVELTIVTLDSRTLARNPTIPAIPTATGANDVPNEVQNFMNSLVANNIKTAKTFSTTVRLINGTE